MSHAWWDGVFAFALESVGAVEAEVLDADEAFGGLGRGARGGVVDEEGRDGAGAVLDVCERLVMGAGGMV